MLGIFSGLWELVTIPNPDCYRTREPAPKRRESFKGRTLPVPPAHAECFCFGDNPGEWDAFSAGWLAFCQAPTDGPCPEAKHVGLYPENQNHRVSWERGWTAAQGASRPLMKFCTFEEEYERVRAEKAKP